MLCNMLQVLALAFLISVEEAKAIVVRPPFLNSTLSSSDQPASRLPASPSFVEIGIFASSTGLLSSSFSPTTHSFHSAIESTSFDPSTSLLDTNSDTAAPSSDHSRKTLTTVRAAESSKHATSASRSDTLQHAKSSRSASRSTSQVAHHSSQAPSRRSGTIVKPASKKSTRHSSITGKGTFTSRIHTTVTVTSKPHITFGNITKAACYAGIPNIQYVSWALKDPPPLTSPSQNGTDDDAGDQDSDSEVEDQASSSSATKNNHIRQAQNFVANDTTLALPRNAQGTVYTEAISFATNWNGGHMTGAYNTTTTVAYPTQFWDYNPWYEWVGSTIGADPSCSVQATDVGTCAGVETLWSHPPFRDVVTTAQLITDGDSLGMSYTPTWVAYTPGSQDLSWFLKAFPDIVALRECETTVFKRLIPKMGPAFPLTEHSSAIEPSVTAGCQADCSKMSLTTDSSAIQATSAQPANAPPTVAPATTTNLATSSFVHFSVHGNVQTRSNQPAGEIQTAVETNLPSLVPLPAQIFSEALQQPNSEQDSDQAVPTTQPVPVTFAGLTFQQSQSQVFLDGSSVKVGATTTIGRGSQATTVIVQTNDQGGTVLQVDNAKTVLPVVTRVPPPSLTMTMAGKTVELGSQEVHIDGQTLIPGSSITLRSQQTTVIAALKIDQSSNTELIIGSSMTVLPQRPAPTTFTLGKDVVTQSADSFYIDGQTLKLGQTATIISGRSTVVAAIQTDSSGHTRVVVGTSATILSAAPGERTYSFNGEAVTQSSDAFLVEGKTVKAGQSVTLGTGSLTTVIAIQTDGSGHTKLIVGSSTTTLPAAMSAISTAGLLVTPLASDAVIVSGRTLSLGSTITVSGSAGPTRLSLTTEQGGQLAIIEPSTTIVLSSTRQSGSQGVAGSSLSANAQTKGAGVTGSATSATSSHTGGAAERYILGQRGIVALVLISLGIYFV